MVVLGKWNKQSVTLSFKPSSFTVSLEQPSAEKPFATDRYASQSSQPVATVDSQVFSFDGHGRLWTLMVGGISYRRGLNGRIVAKWQTGRGMEGSRERRWLTDQESSQLQDHAHQTVAQLLTGLNNGEVVLQGSLPPDELAVIENAARYDARAYEQDVSRYHQIYQPVGILPPDQYMAVVLQATEGCSFNTCTFCNFYRDRRFRIKPQEDFLNHARQVREYLGNGLRLRRTIFLGDANALVVPMPRLLTLFDAVHTTFDVESLGGIYAFLDGFSGEKKTSADYAELASRGMKRIYIGMESGSADLLRFLKKPGAPEDVLQAVQAIKAGGLAVGIIILLGAGGHQYARAHIHDTVQAVNAMPLDADDLIYFSELVESEGLEYTQAAFAQHLKPLNEEERGVQGRAIESGLRFDTERGVPHISRYDIREFVY